MKKSTKNTKRPTKKNKTAAPQINLADCIPLPEAAPLADVSEAYLRRLVKAGKILGVQIGRNYLVDKNSAKNFERHPTFGRPRG